MKHVGTKTTPEQIAARQQRINEEKRDRASLAAAIEYVTADRAYRRASCPPAELDIFSRLEEATKLVDERENDAAEAEMRSQRHRITFEDYCWLSQKCNGDPRLRIVYKLHLEMESLEKDLAGHISEMQREAQNIAEYGATRVYEHITSGSRYHDVGASAAKVRALVDILGSMIHPLDDPAANDIDRFVHERLNG